MKVEKANPGRITVFFDQRHYLWLNTDIDPCVVCSAIFGLFPIVYKASVLYSLCFV